MPTHVLLHLDVLKATAEQRADFYELLELNGWEKAHPVFTTWKTAYTYPYTTHRMEAARVIGEISKLARDAGVPGLHVVAQCGNHPAFTFEHPQRLLVPAKRRT